jgi:hypothetical protein
MLISISTLESAALRYSLQERAATLDEAKAARRQTAFLCHSPKDATLAKGLQVYVKEMGWDVYIDWEDSQMPDTPDRLTAERIQNRVGLSDWFLFLATPRSVSSRWCPWAIGYVDGIRPLESILIIPTTDNAGTWYGKEYLQLYRRIQYSDSQQLGVYGPREQKGPLLETLSIVR